MSKTLVLVCVYCERGVSEDALDDAKLHRDHIVPHSRGGGDDASNSVTACKACNLAKGDRTPSEWKPSGLPAWLYDVERSLVERYKMTSRRRRSPVARPEPRALFVPGARLVKATYPLCTEYKDPSAYVEGDDPRCLRAAEFEANVLDPWTAKCHRCARCYRASNVRELDALSSHVHILIQLRAGMLNRERETTLITLARLGNVSLDEYLDFAIQMFDGNKVVRDGLKAAAPQLRLEMWEPIES